MTNRTKQLLLEIMLLRMRYSSQEFRVLERALSQRADRGELQSIIDLVHQFDAPMRSRNEPASDLQPDIPRLKREFLSSLRADKRPRPRAMQRLKSVATALGILISEQRDSAISQIEEKLNTLNEQELAKFLSSHFRHWPAGPDEGFLGLAKYILKKDDTGTTQ